MDKGSDTKRAETRMEQSASDVRESIVDFADTSFVHAINMVQQGELERRVTIKENEYARSDLVESLQKALAYRISFFQRDAQHMIADKPLSKENLEAAQSWLYQKLDSCSVVTTDAIESVKLKNKTVSDTIENAEHTASQTIDQKLENFAVYLKNEKFKSSWDRFSDTVDSKTKSIEDLLDTKQNELNNRVTVKYNELKALIESKDYRQENFINSCKNSLKQLLDAFAAKQEREQRYGKHDGKDNKQQNNRDNRQQSQQGSKNRNNGSTEDPRLKKLIGEDTESPKRPYKIILKNIDHHRGKGKSDSEIYRLLVKNFHPDTSDHEYAEQVIRILTSSYDPKKKKFAV